MLMAHYHVDEGTRNTAKIGKEVCIFDTDSIKYYARDKIGSHLAGSSNHHVCKYVSLEILKLEVNVVIGEDSCDPLNDEDDKVFKILLVLKQLFHRASLDLCSIVDII